MDVPPRSITELLGDWGGGDEDALNALMPFVYQELQRLARRYLDPRRGGVTLQPTALVHEVYLKLAAARPLQCHNRAHFFAVAARAMRFILVDHCRRRHYQKRGGSAIRISMDDTLAVTTDRPDEVLALDGALHRLGNLDARKSRVAELRLFTGLSVQETADLLSVAQVTVMRHWRFAKAWLQRELSA